MLAATCTSCADPDKLRAWVRRMAVRGACRARGRNVADLDTEHIERLPAADFPDVDVAAAVAGLPERERLAVTLVYGLGYRQDEAAQLMGVASGTVYSSVWRARRKLARLLAEMSSSRGRARGIRNEQGDGRAERTAGGDPAPGAHR